MEILMGWGVGDCVLHLKNVISLNLLYTKEEFIKNVYFSADRK